MIEGFRVWYDNGLVSDEEYAQRIGGAEAHIFLLSQAAAESHNFREALNFAIAERKTVLSLRPESVMLPLGMRLQLENNESITYHDVLNEAFLAAVINSSLLSVCRDSNVCADAESLSQWKKHAAEYGAIDREEKKPKNGFLWISPKREDKKESKLSETVQREVPIRQRTVREEVGDQTVMLFESDDDKTILIGESDIAEDDDCTIIGTSFNPAFIFRVKTEEIVSVKNEVSVIGRSRSRCDIAFEDNREISGTHAEIWKRGNGYVLHNLQPTNGTSVDGRMLNNDEWAELNACSEILLADEQFFIVYAEAYERIYDEQKICLLKSRDTGECKIIAENSLPLDRHHKWRGDVLGDQHIHRSGHAEIYREHGRIYLRDLGSRHGTFLNGRQLTPNIGVELHDRDAVSVVKTEFVYYEVKI